MEGNRKKHREVDESDNGTDGGIRARRENDKKTKEELKGIKDEDYITQI